jgi:hypothetical protein
MNAEQVRLDEAREQESPWNKWGPANERPVQDLGEGEFRLQDGDLVAVARGAVGGGEWVG